MPCITRQMLSSVSRSSGRGGLAWQGTAGSICPPTIFVVIYLGSVHGIILKTNHLPDVRIKARTLPSNWKVIGSSSVMGSVTSECGHCAGHCKLTLSKEGGGVLELQSDFVCGVSRCSGCAQRLWRLGSWQSSCRRPRRHSCTRSSTSRTPCSAARKP